MKPILLVSLSFITLVSSIAFAESAYVYDKQKVWTRKGPSKDFGVKIKVLPGTRVDILSVNTETGFTQVKDVKGREFWIQTAYLSKTPTANLQLESALQENQKIRQDSKRQIDELKKRVTSLESLESINQNLQGQLSKLKVSMEQLEQSNIALTSRFNREVFFAGGLTVIGGLLVGLILGSRGRKQKDGWH